jgi:hypothetical protein
VTDDHSSVTCLAKTHHWWAFIRGAMASASPPHPWLAPHLQTVVGPSSFPSRASTATRAPVLPLAHVYPRWNKVVHLFLGDEFAPISWEYFQSGMTLPPRSSNQTRSNRPVLSHLILETKHFIKLCAIDRVPPVQWMTFHFSTLLGNSFPLLCLFRPEFVLIFLQQTPLFFIGG